MQSSHILPLNTPWTGCDNRTCGDSSRCHDCEGCRNWKAANDLAETDEPVKSVDELIVLLAEQIKANIPDSRLQLSEARNVGVKLLGELEKLNKT